MDALSVNRSVDAGFSIVDLVEMKLAVTDADELIRHIMDSLALGRGGWILTANLDILRRYALDHESRALYSRADISVADGMPLVWASYLKGTPLPERIAGSSLILPLCHAAASKRYRAFLLGGEPGAGTGTAARLAKECPDLIVCGCAAPMVSAQPTPEQVEAMAAMLEEAKPNIVFVAMGSPKQEKIIDALRDRFPSVWWIGVGISFSFLAGQVQRAPRLMQQLGLEWVHRLVQDPGRLARRYLIDDLPFIFVLMGSALRDRFRPAIRQGPPA